MQALDNFFEEYKVGQEKKEIKRIEEILTNKSMWFNSNEDICRYKEFEKQHAYLFKMKKLFGVKGVELFGSKKETKIPSSFMPRQAKEDKLMR